MLYAIYAYESIYEGFYGINSYVIAECNSEEEAEEIGRKQSFHVMNSYYCIMDEFCEPNSDSYDKYSDEWYEYIENSMEENCAYEIYPILRTKGRLVENFIENLVVTKINLLKLIVFNKSA